MSFTSALVLAGCGGGSNSPTQPPPTGGGGSSDTNPVPSIVSISPSSVAAGSSAQTLTLTGSGFISASVVQLNGTALATTYSSATSLQTILPAAAIAADGTVKVAVTNPAPGGGTSPADLYTITVPTPTITALSPQSVPAGVAATITITGSGFEANSVAQWNGAARATTFVNASTLQLALSAADVQNYGAGQVTVANPGLAPTASLVLSIPFPQPVVASVSPASIVAGSAAQTIVVNGSGFTSASTIGFNGTSLATTFVSSSSIQGSLPSAAIAADGNVPVTVTNPAPGGGSSAALVYTITVPSPKLNSLSPQSVPRGVAATITITGAGFEANSVAQWNGAARPTTFVNSNTLQVALTSADVQTYGTGHISVANPGLPPTTPLDLAILSNMPTITGLSPSSVIASTTSATPVQVYIDGSGFAANATVQANGQSVPVLSETPGTIVVSLAASYFTTPGSINIVVSNPGSPVVSSSAFALTVAAASAPTFIVNPNSVAAGSPDTTITLNSNGSGFYADSVVSWNSTPLVTTYMNSYSVAAVIPAALISGFAQASISVSASETSGQNMPPQPFSTYLSLPVNDIVYNATDGFIYASIPGFAGGTLGNSIAAIDPVTGVVQKTISVGSEPDRLALSSDGTQLFAGLDEAASVRQVNLTTGTAGIQFSIGTSSTNYYASPVTAVSLAAVPGAPNSVAVSASSGNVTIYDSGVARPNTTSGLSGFYGSASGALSFGSSASTLYVTNNGTLYQLTVGSTGITAGSPLNTVSAGSTLQYDNGRLYIPEGIVLDAATGDQLGQFSSTNGYSSQLIATVGPIVSDSSLNTVWIVPSNSNNPGEVLSYNETTFNPVDSVLVTGIGSTMTSGYSTAPADLIRWGQDGLAFHTGNQLYVLQGPIVKDVSSTPADIGVTVQAPATGTTGTALTYTMVVQNLGPNTAQGVSLTGTLPQAVIFGSISSTQGTCTGPGVYYCDLGSISSGSSVTVTATVTPTAAAAIVASASVSSVSYDAVPSNNQSSATTTVSGGPFNGPPLVTQLSPTVIQAGSNSFTLTVDGEGFTSASTVLWNGQALPTTLISGGQLTATVDASLVQQLGWSQVSVSTATPGGGVSAEIPFTIYQLVNVPANAMAYDPFTRMLYAVLPSSSTNPTGNSIVAINPTNGAVGSPVLVGSEPNLLSETSDGNYFYIGLSGADSLGRFNLLTQAMDITVPLPTNATYSSGDVAAIAIATVPGSDSSLAVESNTYSGIGILDISGSTGTFRPHCGMPDSGDYPVFTDATHYYAYGSFSSGFFYRYSINANGVSLIDNTNLQGLGGPGQPIAVDDGLVFGVGGGIVNPMTTPPTQLGVLPVTSGQSAYASPIMSESVVPYAAEGKSFNITTSEGNGISSLDRFDTGTFTLDAQIPLPPGNAVAVPGTRWGQDGLAYLLPGLNSSNTTGSTQQILLLRGPFVLPAEASSNAAPALTTTDHNTITAGSGNVFVTITGTGFLPGATAFWNGSPRTTNFVDSAHLSVAVAAADVQSAAAITLTAENPGSGASNSISVTVQ